MMRHLWQIKNVQESEAKYLYCWVHFLPSELSNINEKLGRGIWRI